MTLPWGYVGLMKAQVVSALVHNVSIRHHHAQAQLGTLDYGSIQASITNQGSRYITTQRILNVMDGTDVVAMTLALQIIYMIGRRYRKTSKQQGCIVHEEGCLRPNNTRSQCTCHIRAEYNRLSTQLPTGSAASP
jgi:hypothetical protein